MIADVLASPFDRSLGQITTQLAASLDDPMRVWRHIFENQLTDKDRMLLVVLFTLGGKSDYESLQEAVLSLQGWNSTQVRRSLRILEGTFIKVYVEERYQFIEFSNPSVNDFMILKLSDDSSYLAEVLRSVHSFDQIIDIWVYHPASNSCRDGDLYLDLRPLAHLLEDAALATLELPETSRGLVGRLAIALRISSALGLSRLSARVAEIISMQGRVYGGQYDDIAALIRATGASEDPLIRKHHKAVLMEGLAALFNRDRSEKGVFTAGIYAHQLADYVDKRLLDNIDAQAEERVDQLMEIYEWGPVSRDQDLDPEVFEQALRYVDIFSNAHERWPMAESAMEDYPIANDELAEEEDEEGDDFDWTDDPVFQIMSSLADFRAQD